MKLLKRISVILISLLLLILVLGILIARLYEDKVKLFFVAELNKNLTVEIKVEDIDFSVLRMFPFASLEFSKVSCPPVGGFTTNNDTLFSAEKLYLKFSIMDIFKNNYSIKRIEVVDARVNVKIDKKGLDNYHFWKITNTHDQTKEKEFSIDLSRIEVTHAELSYLDRSSGQDLKFTINSMNAGGRIMNKSAAFNMDIDASISHFKKNKEIYLQNKSLSANLNLIADSVHFQVLYGKIGVNNAFFNLSGSVEKSKKSKTASTVYIVGIKLNGKRLEIPLLIALVPDKKLLAPYRISGLADLDVFIDGIWSSDEIPQIQCNYQVRNGKYKEVSSWVVLTDIETSGTFTNRAGALNKGSALLKGKPLVDIEVFSAKLGTDALKGKLRLWDFDMPKIDLAVTGTIDMENLKNINSPGFDSMTTSEGKIKMELSVKGKLKQLKNYNIHDLREMKISGLLEANDLLFRYNQGSLPVSVRGGSLVFSDNDVSIKAMNMSIENSDFLMEGYFKNLLPFLILDKQQLYVDAQLKAGKIELNELLKDYGSASTADTVYELQFPGNIQFNLHADVDELYFRKFKAKNIKGDFGMKNKKLIAKGLTFNAMDGKVSADGVIDGTDEKNLLISCEADVEKMDIYKMFYQFENFGQDYITDNNLKGIATANIQFVGVMQPDLSLVEDKIYTKADITIWKGELINYEPLMALSDYIEVSELKHVKFSTLQNRIEIKNREIHIPSMEILSSALNISTSGTHTFDQKINYKFKVYLPELLAKKSKKKKKENDEFGVVEDDGLGLWLFLTMTGTVDNPVIKYDKKGYVQKIGEDIKSEKQTLKKILNEEFGWFKKDTTITNKKKEKFNDDYFIIEWDDKQVDKDRNEEDDL